MTTVAANRVLTLKQRRVYPRIMLAAAVVGLPFITALLLNRSFHLGVAFVIFVNMAVIALARPFELLAAFLFQMPLIPRWGEMLGVRVPDLMTPVALLLFVGSLVRWLTDRDREPLKPVWFDVIAMSFLALGWFELYDGPVEVNLAKAYSRNVLLPGLFYLSIRLLMLDRRRMQQLVRWQLAAGMLLSLIVVVEAVAHRSLLYESVSEVFREGGLYQPGGAFGRPFLAGAYLAILLPLYLYGALGGLGERYRRWFRAGTALSVIGVGLSFERGAWLAAGVALGILFLYRPLRRPAGIVIAASVVLAGAGLLFSSHSWLETRVAERSNVQDRVRFLAAGVGILQSPEWNWATGIGEGGYLEIAYRYMPPRSYYDVDRKTEADKNRAQHNDYLRTVIEHGVPGGLLLLLMVVLLIGRGVKLARDERRGVTNLDGRLGIALLAAASTVLVDAATHNTLVESQIMTGFWLVCALLYSDQAMTKDTLSLLALRQESHVPGAGSR